MRKISENINLAKSTVTDIIERFTSNTNINIKGKRTGYLKDVTAKYQ